MMSMHTYTQTTSATGNFIPQGGRNPEKWKVGLDDHIHPILSVLLCGVSKPQGGRESLSASTGSSGCHRYLTYRNVTDAAEAPPEEPILWVLMRPDYMQTHHLHCRGTRKLISMCIKHKVKTRSKNALVLACITFVPSRCMGTYFPFQLPGPPVWSWSRASGMCCTRWQHMFSKPHTARPDGRLISLTLPIFIFPWARKHLVNNFRWGKHDGEWPGWGLWSLDSLCGRPLWSGWVSIACDSNK